MNINSALKKFVSFSNASNYLGNIITRCARYPHNSKYEHEAFNLLREYLCSLLDEIEDDLFDEGRKNA